MAKKDPRKGELSKEYQVRSVGTTGESVHGQFDERDEAVEALRTLRVTSDPLYVVEVHVLKEKDDTPKPTDVPKGR